MAGRVVLAAVLSAIGMFMWGFVYWGLMNVTAKVMAPLPRAADILAPLRAEQTPDGMYVYPGPVSGMDEKAQAEWESKIKEGPIVHMSYRAQGISPMDPVMFAKGLAHCFVVALLAGTLLAVIGPALHGYTARVGVVVLIAVIAAIWTNVGEVIWRFDSIPFCVAQTIYQIVAGLVMGLITAAVVRTPRNQRITAPM